MSPRELKAIADAMKAAAIPPVAGYYYWDPVKREWIDRRKTPNGPAPAD